MVKSGSTKRKVRAFLRLLKLAVVLQLMAGAILFVLGTTGQSGEISAYVSSFLSILLSCMSAGLVMAIFGYKKTIISAGVMFNLAPIWFLYLEGVIGGEGTATDLPPHLRVQALGVSVIFVALFNAFYVVLVNQVEPLSHKLNRRLQLLQIKSLVASGIAAAAFVVPIIIIGYLTCDSLGELWYALTAGRQNGESGTLLRRGTIGNTNSLLMPLMWVWQLTPTFAAVAFFSSRSIAARSWAMVAVAAGVATAWFTFLGGSRGTLIFVIAAPALLFMVKADYKRVSYWITLGVGFFSAIGIMEFQKRTRGNMLSQIMGSAKSKEELTSFNPLNTHRDNNLYFLSLIVEHIPRDHDFEGFNDFFTYLINPVPRVIFPAKPVLKGAMLGQDYVKPVFRNGPLVVGTSSITVSLPGEAYSYYGFIGLAPVALVFAFWCSWFDSYWLNTPVEGLLFLGVQASAAFMAFWGFRGLGAFITFLYPLLLLYIAANCFVWFFLRKRAGIAG